MNEYKHKKVLITGAGGFIGRHLGEGLIRSGAELSVLFWDKLPQGDNLFLKEIPESELAGTQVIYGDLRDRDMIAQALEGIDIVFHLAAMTSVPFSFQHPRQSLDINFNGLVNLLDAAREKAVSRVVVTSTAAVYGPPRYLPIDEKHPLSPRSPYAAGKAAGDEVALAFFHSYKLPVVVMRLLNTFGPGQTMRAVIPSIILQALKDGKLKLGRTDSIRDFNFIDNVVAGFMAAGIQDGVNGEVINLGSGEEKSIGDVVDTLEKILGKDLDIDLENQRKRTGSSDSDRLSTSIEKARQLLDYEPAVSFEQGMRRCVDYYTRNLDLFYNKEYMI